MKPLWEITRDLHHACEQHPVGAAMASGNPPMDWYAAWLKALLQIHAFVDPHAPECIRRSDRIKEDIEVISSEVADLSSATLYISSLTTPESIDGALYVLTGAHLMGGEIMRRRLVGYPTNHLEWNDRRESLTELQLLRTRGELGEEARACFTALLAIMDEIQTRYYHDVK